MALFHVLVWKSDRQPAGKHEPVEKYMLEATSLAEAIERGTEQFSKDHPEESLNDHRVQAVPG